MAHYLHHSTFGPLARGLCGAGVVSAVSLVSSMAVFVCEWQGCRQKKWIRGHTVHVDFHGSVQCASHTRRERRKTVESISVFQIHAQRGNLIKVSTL